jgi:hypothetical protein
VDLVLLVFWLGLCWRRVRWRHIDPVVWQQDDAHGELVASVFRAVRVHLLKALAIACLRVPQPWPGPHHTTKQSCDHNPPNTQHVLIAKSHTRSFGHKAERFPAGMGRGGDITSGAAAEKCSNRSARPVSHPSPSHHHHTILHSPCGEVVSMAAVASRLSAPPPPSLVSAMPGLDETRDELVASVFRAVHVHLLKALAIACHSPRSAVARATPHTRHAPKLCPFFHAVHDVNSRNGYVAIAVQCARTNKEF